MGKHNPFRLSIPFVEGLTFTKERVIDKNRCNVTVYPAVLETKYIIKSLGSNKTPRRGNRG